MYTPSLNVEQMIEGKILLQDRNMGLVLFAKCTKRYGNEVQIYKMSVDKLLMHGSLLKKVRE